MVSPKIQKKLLEKKYAEREREIERRWSEKNRKKRMKK